MFAFRTPLLERPAEAPLRLSLPARAAVDGDAVRLRADWPALLALTGYAARATWLFGHRAAVLECVEHDPHPCMTRRAAADPTRFQLSLAAWTTPIVRRVGNLRQLEFFSRSDAAIAAVQLDGLDPAVDEMIWNLLADDEMQPAPMPKFVSRAHTSAVHTALRLVERTEDFDRLITSAHLSRGYAYSLAGPHVATALPTDTIARAVTEAARAHLRVRVQITNAGGSISWAPAVQHVGDAGDYLEVRSHFGRVQLARRIGPTWLVHLSGEETCGPALEAESMSDGGWIRIDAAPQDRAQWRDLCATLAATRS